MRSKIRDFITKNQLGELPNENIDKTSKTNNLTPSVSSVDAHLLDKDTRIDAKSAYNEFMRTSE